jgi:hypothetical protein
MFSPVKAIAAGAIVFALGGVLLIAQPFDQQGGSVPGAATDAEREAPVEFTARTVWDRQVSQPVQELTEDGVRTEVGGAWQFRFTETSDPRIDGTMTDNETQVFYPSGDIDPDGELWVLAGANRIENDGGAWQQVPRFNHILPWKPEPDGGDGVYVGEGGYEGYIALVESEGGVLRGVIIEADLPTVPEPWSAE